MSKNRQGKKGVGLEDAQPVDVSKESGEAADDDAEIPSGQGSPRPRATSPCTAGKLSSDPVAYFIDKNTLLNRQTSQGDDCAQETEASRENATTSCDMPAGYTDSGPRSVPSFEDYYRAMNNPTSAFTASRVPLSLGGFQQPPLFSTCVAPGQGFPYSGAGAPVVNTGTWAHAGQGNAFLGAGPHGWGYPTGNPMGNFAMQGGPWAGPSTGAGMPPAPGASFMMDQGPRFPPPRSQSGPSTLGSARDTELFYQFQLFRAMCNGGQNAGPNVTGGGAAPLPPVSSGAQVDAVDVDEEQEMVEEVPAKQAPLGRIPKVAPGKQVNKTFPVLGKGVKLTKNRLVDFLQNHYEDISDEEDVLDRLVEDRGATSQAKKRRINEVEQADGDDRQDDAVAPERAEKEAEPSPATKQLVDMVEQLKKRLGSMEAAAKTAAVNKPVEQVVETVVRTELADEDEKEEGEIEDDIDRIIATLYRENKPEEAVGSKIDGEFASSIDTMCWRAYADQEVAKLLKATVPPSNTVRLQKVALDARVADNMVPYGKKLESKVAMIHRAAQHAMVPIIQVIEIVKTEKKIANKDLLDKLTTALQLGGYTCTRACMTRRDIARDATPSDFKVLTSQRHEVSSTLFGKTIEDEYTKLMKDRMDKRLLYGDADKGKKMDKFAGVEPFLVKGGRGNQNSAQQTQQNAYQKAPERQPKQDKQKSNFNQGYNNNTYGGPPRYHNNYSSDTNQRQQYPRYNNSGQQQYSNQYATNQQSGQYNANQYYRN